jgi:hypothetical protein
VNYECNSSDGKRGQYYTDDGIIDDFFTNPSLSFGATLVCVRDVLLISLNIPRDDDVAVDDNVEVAGNAFVV